MKHMSVDVLKYWSFEGVDNMTTIEKKIDELFDELVPFEGKCDSLAGEIIRAFCRIRYRYYNDGDQIGIGYGNETCNASARFLEANCNDSIREVVGSMWNSFSVMKVNSKLWQNWSLNLLKIILI